MFILLLAIHLFQLFRRTLIGCSAAVLRTTKLYFPNNTFTSIFGSTLNKNSSQTTMNGIICGVFTENHCLSAL